MPEFHGSRGRGFRPPWWPEGEPWPPAGPGRWAPGGTARWHGMRRFFLRRVALALVGLFVLVFGASALAVALFLGARGRGSVVAAAVGAIVLLLFVVAMVGRAIRRMAAPIGDVMDAADRVAAGDYGTRVQPRGSREICGLARAFNAMAERLQSNEDQRRSLLADVAHELRTPLSVIRGNAEGMIDGLYPTDEAHLGPIVEETDVMARLLDDLATLSTAEAGTLALYRERVAPADLVGESVSAFRTQAVSSGVALEGRADPSLPDLDVDPVRIHEVLANLLSNALRHTPGGGSVSLTAHASDDGRGVRFTVRDTGSGIPPDQLPLVFERFTRSADSGGAGLGLAIAKGLVGAHGGTIEAESEPGHGTTIRFTLPIPS
jgi:signal transduction histidine kinase